jgi:DNA-binding NtrC family response regulator
LSLICTSLNGFAALSFLNATQAVAAAAGGSSPDLLLSDIRMPGISGIELAMQFQRSYPQCRILLFSGQAAGSSALEEARQLGYDFELLHKPIHPADLIQKLHAYSANSGHAREQSYNMSRARPEMPLPETIELRSSRVRQAALLESARDTLPVILS